MSTLVRHENRENNYYFNAIEHHRILVLIVVNFTKTLGTNQLKRKIYLKFPSRRIYKSVELVSLFKLKFYFFITKLNFVYFIFTQWIILFCEKNDIISFKITPGIIICVNYSIDYKKRLDVMNVRFWMWRRCI